MLQVCFDYTHLYFIILIEHTKLLIDVQDRNWDSQTKHHHPSLISKDYNNDFNDVLQIKITIST